MPKAKKESIKFLSEHTASLNHWRDELLKLEKTYYSKDLEKERMIKNMINKYLDDVLAYNKKDTNIKK
jgi:hypothetical protein